MVKRVWFFAVRVACGALGAIYSTATIPLCIISPMLFDSPGSERNKWTRVLFAGAVLAPFSGAATLLFAAQPWLMLQHPAAHATVACVPVLSDAALIVSAIHVIARMPNGLDAPMEQEPLVVEPLVGEPLVGV